MPVSSESRSRRGLLAWQAFIVIAATGYAILHPVAWVFGTSETALGLFVRWTSTAIFVADIVVSVLLLSRAPITRTGRVVYGLEEYRRGLLAVDVIAALPLYALMGDPRLGVLGLVKLVKVAHLLAEWRRRAVRFDTFVLLAYGGYWLGLCGHWLSCGWLALGGIAFGPTAGTTYVRSLYWTVTTVTGVGYGDIVPTTDPQRIYALLTMLVGFTFFGYVVGVMARVIGRQDPGTERFRVGVESLAHATRLGVLPKDLQDRVYDYHWYVWRNRLGYDEESFLSGLPKTLRGRVSYHLKKGLLARVDLFKEVGEAFLKDIALYLEPAFFTPGDLVFEVGDHGEEMFFIAAGSVEVLTSDGKFIRVLGEGDFFGEIAVFSQGVRTATVRAAGFCELYVLSRDALNRIAERHPEVHKRLMARALERTGGAL